MNKYRMLVRFCSSAPSPEVRREMEKILHEDFRTVYYRFDSTEEQAGAMMRAIFWAEGITFRDVATGSTVVRVQRLKPDNRDALGKALGPLIPEYEEVGGWDAFGVEYGTGR